MARGEYFEVLILQGEESGQHGEHPQHRGVAQPGQIKDEQVRSDKNNDNKKKKLGQIQTKVIQNIHHFISAPIC